MRTQDYVLAGGMLVAGTINTISSKFQDTFEVIGLKDKPPHKFEHPAVQTLCMFIGELLCLFAYFVAVYRAKRNQGYAPIVENPSEKIPIWTFLVPAMCDMTASTLMYIGLVLTYPSVYQMLRGMIVVFTGLFSRIFLKRVLYLYHWLGMAAIIVGTAVVGLSSVIYGTHGGAPNPLLGDVLVVAAQLVAATQMVVEEKFVGKYNAPPLKVVGSEGAWGVIVTAFLLFILYWIPVLKLNEIFVVTLAPVFVIAVKPCHHLLIGFVVLLFGTSLFNEIFRLPGLYYPSKQPKGFEEDPLLHNNGGKGSVNSQVFKKGGNVHEID